MRTDAGEDGRRRETARSGAHLVVLAGVAQEVPEEVDAGALAHQDEVGGAVGQVGGGRQALRTAGTRAAHVGGVDGDEFAVDLGPSLTD